MKLSDPVVNLKGVGEKNAKKLQRLGIFNIRDLLQHYPYRYEDYSKITPIAEIKAGGNYVVKAKIAKIKSRFAFKRRMGVLEALVEDDSGSLAVVWFNQPYLKEILKQGENYLFAGDVGFYEALQMQNPIWELDKPETTHVGRIVPVYPLTAGIYPKWLRSLLKNTLARVSTLREFLPSPVIEKYNLIGFDAAIRQIHFPESLDQAENAKKRLAFNELFYYQLKIFLHRNKLLLLPARPIAVSEKLNQDFLSLLPFALTTSQKSSLQEILQDFAKPHPANRLLCGDVGSGKTVVAAAAMLQVAAANFSAAIMAPTEILARQHFSNFTRFPLLSAYSIALLTSSQAVLWDGKTATELKKPDLLKKLERQEIKIAIGTHSLIQKNVNLNSLALVIVDEQHRFGVQQRAYLQQNSSEQFPHFLSLSATPIPRTLALTLYGDLNISRITELPSGRKIVRTEVVLPSRAEEINKKIDKMIGTGQQIFVICPLIDPSDKLGVKSATEEYERLKNSIFSHRRIGLLHGKLSSKEKQEAMQRFGNRQLDILVSTTVVEVGVDFPGATVMLIHGAERFGLAQLHQLRGRVGRSDLQSYCYLLPENLTSRAKQRMEALVEHHNGLELAEIDLKLRGPGEIYGQLQSGYPEFKIADVFDANLLEAARQTASEILLNYQPQKYPLIAKKIIELEKSLHFE